MRMAAPAADPKSHSSWSTLGLSNGFRANNCFFNSAMQVFMRLEQFKSLPAPEIDEDATLTQLRDFMSQVYPNPAYKTFDPVGLRDIFTKETDDSKVVFPNGVQQDVAEFINVLLDRTRSSGFLREAWFSKSETGYCMSCNRPSTPHHHPASEVHANFPLQIATDQVFDLPAMIDANFGQEIIDGYACARCPRDIAKLMKTVAASNPPDILLVQIVRFANDEKIVNFVDIPFTMNFSSRSYRLHGIIDHKGSTPASGHYTATVRDNESGQWFRYDDARVEAVHPNAVVTNQAYYVVYTATTIDSSSPVGTASADDVTNASSSDDQHVRRSARLAEALSTDTASLSCTERESRRPRKRRQIHRQG